MEYLSITEAKSLPGLRLVLTRGVPGPWSEAAKALFAVRQVSYLPVEQHGGGANPELVALTGHRNAPIALYNDEPPRVRWLEILDLAERLGQGASLIPSDINDRLLMIGISNEIAGEGGFAWNARLLMLHAGVVARGIGITDKNPMYREYQYDADKLDTARRQIRAFLTYLAERIFQQASSGSAYLVGDSLSAADIYWACFSNMLQSLDAEVNPMPEGLRRSWAVLAREIETYDPIVIHQRDTIFARHLQLPLDF